MSRDPYIGQVTTWSDQHHPFIDVEAHELIYRFIRDRYRAMPGSPYTHVHIGDCLDLPGISRWAVGDLILQYEDPILEGLKSLGAHFNRLFKITPRAEVVWIFGNHDDRLRQFTHKHPAWRGITDNPIGLLKAFGDCPDADRVQVVYLDDFTDDFKIGHMHFCHGFSACKHVAAKHVEMYDESVTFGHAHTMQMHTKSKRAYPKAGYCAGHLLSKEARRWLKGEPTRWVRGFAHMLYDIETGHYSQLLLPITDGGFFYGDKHYSFEVEPMTANRTIRKQPANPKRREAARKGARV